MRYSVALFFIITFANDLVYVMADGITWCITFNKIVYMKKICIVAGARPNFIKVAPVIRAIVAARKSGREVDYQLVYAGKEDDPTLEGNLFDDLEIAKPNVYLGVDCENLNELTGHVMAKFERYLQQNPTDVVVVVDDLASTMAVAIVAKKQGVLLAHIAAGTRSFDINMPKEINRLVIDGLSDILFTAVSPIIVSPTRRVLNSPRCIWWATCSSTTFVSSMRKSCVLPSWMNFIWRKENIWC